jgi:Tfp pilus assembly protein PilX
MPRRTGGFLLLPMMLTLVVVGALAWAMTRDAGMNVTGVDAEYDTEVARYLAEAAVNLARWKNNQQNCNGAARFQPTPLYRFSLASGAVGTAAADLVGTMTLNDISVVSNNANNDKNSITVDVSSATTAVPAGSQRIVRTVFRYNLTSQRQATITGSGGANTFIYTGPNPAPQGSMAYMELTDNGPADQSYGLVRFSFSALPKNALVKAATLRLKRFDGESSALPDRGLDVYRVTSAWDPVSATWSVPWKTPGGDYAASPVASGVITTNQYYTWRLDALAAGWADGTVANYGVLLKPVRLVKSRFSAFASGDSDGPQLAVTYFERCT